MKRNIRTVPPNIKAKLTRLGDNIAAGCAKKYTRQQLIDGELAHLGITWNPDKIRYPASVLPATARGKFSRINIDGEEIIRTDLPKEQLYNVIDSPNWGDPSNGTHPVYLPYERYPRDFRAPRELTIEIACNEANSQADFFLFSFRVAETLSKAAPDFERKLFENLNLLQENVGACGVENATTPIADYARSLHVAWDIFPPGTRDEAVRRLFRGAQITQAQKQSAEERYDFFMGLNPRQIIVGNSGFRRYFGALLEDNLAVFENIEYGNACYILYGNWIELSQRSRLEILSGRFGDQFDRVPHIGGWQDKVIRLVEEARN